MSWPEFIVRLIDALAWPVVVLIAILVLRHPLARLVADHPPRRVKVGPLDVEWTREIAEAETELETAGMPARPTPHEPTLVTELQAEAHKAPAVAVLEAHAVLERELRTLLRAKGDRTSDEELHQRGIVGAVGLTRLAVNRGYVPEETYRVVQRATVLRNVVHHGAGDITTEQAMEYLALVDAVLVTLRG